MKELQPNLLDDYEHKVQGMIERHEDDAGFPKLDDYRLTKKMVDDYLYDYQIVLDREGSQRSQLTVYGIIAIIPTLILSAFPESMLPWGKWSLMVGIGMGLALACAIKAVRIVVTKSKLASLKRSNKDVSEYVSDIEKYVRNHE